VGFAIEITEVGPPEYPLIGVLHESIHGEAGFADRLAIYSDTADFLVLMAHLEGNPLGYLVALPVEDGTFETMAVGVLEPYTTEGVEAQLRQRAKEFAHSRGYRTTQP
jgi:hypothetical protein